MDVNISFRSVENKCLLWDLMLKNNLFTNISPDKETLVKKLFESKVDMISNERKNLLLFSLIFWDHSWVYKNYSWWTFF